MDDSADVLDAKRIRNILKELNTDLVEREEIIQLSLLAVLSGQSVFLYGPPGTAKSMIATRLSSAFDGITFFEYLMQRFSTPEEIFGPISISELKQDRYVRKTKGFLPEANMAFLDEIWKSNPAILNTLLTIINERKFRNGEDVRRVPLIAIIAASNEFPVENSGLEALYDRFIMRIKVPPIRSKRGFETLLSKPNVDPYRKVVFPIKISEWERVRTMSERMTVSGDVLSIIDLIRKGIKSVNSEREDSFIIVSDRRWQKAVSLLRTSAYICRKDEIGPLDCLLLVNCLWSKDSDQEVIEKIVLEAVSSRFSAKVKAVVEWKERFTKMDETITEYLQTTIPKSEFVDYVPSEIRRNNEFKSLCIKHNGMDVYVPVSRLYPGSSFSQFCTGPDGRSVSLLFKVDRYDSNVIELTIGTKRYSIATSKLSMEEMEKRSLRLAESLSSMERELDSIDQRYGDSWNINDDDISPFIPKRYIAKLRDIVTEGDSDCQKCRNRISVLWGKLDEHRGV